MRYITIHHTDTLYIGSINKLLINKVDTLKIDTLLKKGGINYSPFIVIVSSYIIIVHSIPNFQRSDSAGIPCVFARGF